MIIDRSELEFNAFQKAQYSWQLFSGIAVDVIDGIVVAKKLFQQGEEIGDYVLPFPLYESSKFEIDASFLDGDDEPFAYRGLLYNGIAYSLDNGEHSLVRQYENGEVVSEVKYLNGNVISLEHSEPEGNLVQLFQEYAWDENGFLKDFSLYSEGRVQMALHFKSLNKLSLLIMSRNYFQEIDFLKDFVLFNLFDNPGFLIGMSAGERLCISGLGITDSMLADLIMNEGLKETRYLQIYDTEITNLGFIQLIGLTRICQLHLESDFLTSEDVKLFKLAQPNCYVQFNDEVVTI